jgi:hypothetical protein
MSILSFFASKIDSYCERVDFNLLSEPLNLYSNICFILVGLQALLYINSKHKTVPKISIQKTQLTLVILMFCIGIGSALFHAFANRGTMFLDVAPIGAYILVYLWHWSRELMGFTKKISISLIALFCISTLFLTFALKDLPLGGSQSYISVAIFLLAMGTYQKKFGGPSLLLFSAISFLASLFFRSIDPYYCPAWPYGTHFLWHFLNSFVLSLSIFNAFHINENPLRINPYR